MSVLTARDVRLEIGGRVLLDGWSLSLAAGEVVRIAGPSGAGKTSLLRALAQLAPLARGQLRLHGQAPAAQGYPRWRSRVLYAPQAPVMFAGSVADNLRRPFGFAAVTARFEAARAQALLGLLGLAALWRDERDARRLSGGEKQRVQLVRSLLLAPPVMLLDEPTASLGEDDVRAAEALLREHTAGGGSALLVTHDAAQAGRLADRTLSLQGVQPPAQTQPGEAPAEEPGQTEAEGAA